MQRPWKLAPSLEEIFIERYDQLLGWALHLTRNDREKAEDLLHDAFIQFTFTQTDIQDIHNLDNYLYGMLRNIHVSQLRRAGQRHLQQLSIVEYDSAASGLRSIDLRDQIQVQDELRRVCQYACVRKETAMAASVLILRFFHGYYPSEIVQILRNSRSAVSLRLRIARREAKASLSNPQNLNFMSERPTEIFPVNFARTTDDLLRELRQMIFQSRRGECLSSERLKELYTTQTTSPNTKVLGHLVSCAVCLDQVNELLGLPSIVSRFPTDTLGNDTRGRGGPTSGSAGGGGEIGGDPHRGASKYQHWKRQFFEHEPQKLCISVNGFFQGLHKISSQVSEHTLIIDTAEKINFVEVLSEQGVRLVLLSIDDPPPSGPVERSEQVELDNDRSITLKLTFDSPWPTVHVVYQDPNFIEAELLNLETADQALAALAAPTQSSKNKNSPAALWDRLCNSLAWLWRSFTNSSFWLRPGTVTALIAVMLIALVLFMQLRYRARVPTAGELLERSAAAEETTAAQPGQVLHRTINFEEKSAEGKLIARSRIEVWQSVERGVIARRLYDERGTLVAGDWRRSAGVQTLYHHGARPQVRLAPEKRAGTQLLFDEVWQLEPSAKEFARLIGKTESARVEISSTYVISYVGEGTGELIKATLVLSRADLHAIEQTLLIQQGSERREFRFIEGGFERRASSTVLPAVFEPEAELLGPTTSVANPAESAKAAEIKLEPVAPVSAVATAELDEAEVEVRATLQRVGADLGEPIEIVRSATEVEVRGLVNTAERKAELIAALRNISHLKLAIKTVEEASRQAQPAAAPSTRPQTAEQPTPETVSSKLPAQELLERYLARRGADPDEVRSAIEQFSRQALTHAEGALSEAWALRRLAERYPPAEVNRLNDASRRKLEAIVRSHLASLHLHVTRASTLVKPALSAIANESAGAIAGSSGWEAAWPEFSAPLLRTVQQVDRMTTALFIVNSNARVSPSGAAGELLAALALLESQLPHLEKRVAGEFLGNPESLVPKQP